MNSKVFLLFEIGNSSKKNRIVWRDVLMDVHQIKSLLEHWHSINFKLKPNQNDVSIWFFYTNGNAPIFFLFFRLLVDSFVKIFCGCFFQVRVDYDTLVFNLSNEQWRAMPNLEMRMHHLFVYEKETRISIWNVRRTRQYRKNSYWISECCDTKIGNWIEKGEPKRKQNKYTHIFLITLYWNARLRCLSCSQLSITLSP